MRARLHDFLPNAFEGLREASFQVMERRARRLFGLRGHEVGHGFGLNQVDLPLQEGAPGEFALCGRPGAHLSGEAQHGPHDGRAAVAVHLDHVLAGHRIGPRMIEREALVEGLGPIHEAPQHGPPPRKRAPLFSGREDSLKDGERFRSAQADDSDGPTPGGCRERDDGLPLKTSHPPDRLHLLRMRARSRAASARNETDLRLDCKATRVEAHGGGSHEVVEKVLHASPGNCQPSFLTLSSRRRACPELVEGRRIEGRGACAVARGHPSIRRLCAYSG